MSKNIDLKEIEDRLKAYYKSSRNSIQYEIDIVTLKIMKFLEQRDFELSIEYIKYIHSYLFKDIYPFAGQFREINIRKQEVILNGDTVIYGDFRNIEEDLKKIILKKTCIRDIDIINGVSKFSVDIWKVHPFREGNTRTTAVFIEKYLISLGYDVDNTMFKKSSEYFRNALVRGSYSNSDLGIKRNVNFLKMFYENLLLNQSNELNSDNLIIYI